jgi:hypothetical protein
MTGTDEVLNVVDREPARCDDPPGVGGRLRRLCRAATHALPAEGVGVSVMTSDAQVAMAASDPRTSVLEELQFLVGEGPCKDAFGTGLPVLCEDLAGPAAARWPGYAPAVMAHGIRAVFAFPMQVGTARIGAVDVYRGEAGSLGEAVFVRAQHFTAFSLKTLLEPGAATVTPGIDEVGETDFAVYQAQGMVMIQLRVALDEALARLRGYAYAHDRPLTEVAREILAGRLELRDDTQDG